MLRKPRPLPQRFNRPVTPATRNLVQRRFTQRRAYMWQRWQRSIQRLQRKSVSFKETIRRSLFFIVPAAVLFGIAFFIFSPLLHIKEIRVVRSDPRIDLEQVQRGLAPLFNTHIFFLSTQEVVEKLETAVADLEEVEVLKQYPSSLVIRLTLDPIIAKLVIDDPDRDVKSGSGALAQAVKPPSDFLTSEGMYVAYNDAQVRSGTGLLTLSVVDWGVRPVPWESLIDPSILDSIFQAEKILAEQFGQATKSRAVYVRAREFHLKTNLHTLWFDLRSPLSEQIDRYRLFVQTAGPSGAREYVDLRLADKIVYK